MQSFMEKLTAQHVTESISLQRKYIIVLFLNTNVKLCKQASPAPLKKYKKGYPIFFLQDIVN